MDFSRPDNARKINRLKVLNALRKNDFSRAELSREIVLNKVSISEITDALINEGLIVAGEKDMSTQGRPSTKLSIARSQGRVFSFVFTPSTVTASASNLRGQVLRFERFPNDENMIGQVASFINKMTADGAAIYGAAVVGAKKEEVPPESFPWPVIYTSAAEAQARAEIEVAKKAKTLFVSWGDTIEGVYYEKTLRYIPTLGHMKVTNGVMCTCGANGCLEAVASGRVLKRMTGLEQYRRLTSEERGLSAIDDVSKSLAFALSEAVQALGAESVVITGELSSIPEDLCLSISDRLKMILPPKREYVSVSTSQRGDKSTYEGAGIIALDEFFYHSGLLEALNDIQSNPSSQL